MSWCKWKVLDNIVSIFLQFEIKIFWFHRRTGPKKQLLIKIKIKLDASYLLSDTFFFSECVPKIR